MAICGWLAAMGALGIYLRPAVTEDPLMTAQFQALTFQQPLNFIGLYPWQAWRFVTAALVALLAMADLASEIRWWRIFYRALALSSASIVLLGIAQSVSQSPTIFWEAKTRGDGYFFATFIHYSEAGAFLNLVWPLVATLGIGLWLSGPRGTPGRLLTACLCLLMTWGAGMALLLQRSKAAQGLGAVMALILGAFVLRVCVRRRREGGLTNRQLWTGAGPCLLLLGTLATMTFRLPDFSRTARRWEELRAFDVPAKPTAVQTVDWTAPRGADLLLASNDPTRGQFLWDRRLAWGTGWRMIKARPWLGFGLRGWSRAYHQFTGDPFLKTFYLYLQFAHQDALQCLVEWGALGAAGWVALAWGGVRRGLRDLGGQAGDWEVCQWQRLALLLGLASIWLHGLLDFPLQVPCLQWYTLAFLALLWVPMPAASE